MDAGRLENFRNDLYTLFILIYLTSLFLFEVKTHFAQYKLKRLKTLCSLSLKCKIDNKLGISELETSPKSAFSLEKIQKFRQKNC